MRNMSFSLTTPQVRSRTKTVTRRLGWLTLKPGELVQAVVRGQGLRKGERVEKLAVIRVTHVRREPLCRLTDDVGYGAAEVGLEGFRPHSVYLWPPAAFVAMFCATHAGCTPESLVTRIQFVYVERAP